MLAALLENNNNARAQPQPWRIKLDRSAGPSRPRGEPVESPSYEIVDIIAATASFPEISGEHPVARAVRRHKWISEALPFVKESREKHAAAAFLVGAQLADAAAEERHAAQSRLKIEQIVEIIDEVRGAATPVPRAVPVPRAEHTRGGLSREGGGDGIGLFVGGLVVGGLLVGIALGKRSSRRRRV